MKLFVHVMVVMTALAFAAAADAETVHQTLDGDKIHTGDGGNAVEKGKMESKKVDGAEGGTVARVKGDMEQWGYVTAWFGVPTPAGGSVIRFRVWVDGEKPAKYMLYVRGKDAQSQVGELKIPADATKDTFVTVDVPVTSAAEWSGLTIKKAEKSSLPSPWIDTVSVVLPE